MKMKRDRYGFKHRGSLRNRIILNIWIAILPLAILLGYAIYDMREYYTQYDQIVTNITSANAYNMTFKEDIDEEMYQIVIGSANWSNSEEKLKDVDPYTTINTAREQFQTLYDEATDTEKKSRLRSIIRLMNTLEDRVDDILKNVEEGGHYDENMTSFTMNVQILTELVQENIQEYIYYEAQEMEQVRIAVSASAFQDLRIMVVLLIVILVFNIVLSHYLSNKVTDPILELCDANEKFSQGDFSVRVEMDNHNELDNLGESFNRMVTEIDMLVQDIKKEQKNKRKMELSLLQSQINPHFLYNTLDTILWLTDSGDSENAVKMLTSLSSFFRSTLSKGRENITVGEEIMHIKSYLEIQQFRYRDIMEYEISVPEEMHHYYIMKLTLQPLVENALYHGIKNKRGKGKITISGWLDGMDLLLFVRDNGIGMSEDELRRLVDTINSSENPKVKPEESGHGFGLRNVQQRLKLRYGEEYGIRIESRYQFGTVVTVRIPRLVEGDL
ncbi:MAG: sensor histidine kinase [Lachnospiraceae bacterium]|nr:sensor histidine kinase [Lachnospiraceae bacterium]